MKATRVAARTIQQCDHLPRPHRPATLGAALYTAHWHLLDNGSTLAYLRNRSLSRRWAPSDGQEWNLLSSATNWSQAWLAAQFLLGGLPTHRQEPTGRGRNAPCWGCGARLPHKWVWLAATTQDEDAPNVGWCSLCVGDRTVAILPGDPTSNTPALPGPPPPNSGARSACQFCRRGQMGCEHLALFCPVTREAWRLVGNPNVPWWLPSLAAAGNAPLEREDTSRAVAFMHAVALHAHALAPAPATS